jgi:outer membrane protein OmpA-like peptidoglycan-associated protein
LVSRCPENDADGDGVKNGVDRCPTEPGPASEAGCPVADADRDGVPDSSDACPREPGPLEAHGCPLPPPAAVQDSDGDGLADDADACPEVAGDPAHGGCPAPEVAAPEKVELKAGRFELKGKVYFDTNRAIVQERSFVLLDEVAAVMKAHPEVTRVGIDGHTDSVGGEAINQRLSEARARAVRDYLVKAGVEEARLEPRGFGVTKPLASNETPEGREQNRRVEFIVIEE